MRTGRPKQPLTLSAEECERLASLAHRARTLTPIGAAGADRGSRQLGVSHTYIQKPARIGLIAPPANVLQAPFEGKDAAIIVRRPPGMLVAADCLFEPGHSL